MEERKKRLQENENIPPLVQNPLPVTESTGNRDSVKLKGSVKLPAISSDASIIVKSQQNVEARSTVELKDWGDYDLLFVNGAFIRSK